MAVMKFLTVSAFGLAMLLFPTLGNAQSAFFKAPSGIELGVPEGTMLPHDLSGVDQNDREVNLEKLTGDKGIILYIVRSADWCKHCIFQLEEVSKKGSMIEDEGYNIVVLSHDDPSKLARFTRKYDFPYPMISDLSSEIIQAFDLLNKGYLKGTSYYGVAHPAIYVVAPDGLILRKLFNDDFKVRPTVEDILRVINNLGMQSESVKR